MDLNFEEMTLAQLLRDQICHVRDEKNLDPDFTRGGA
jgi:hypothetical protein